MNATGWGVPQRPDHDTSGRDFKTLNVTVPTTLRLSVDVRPCPANAAFIDKTIAVLIGDAVSLSSSDLVVLAALAASGSYFVLPAVVRYDVPEARPSRCFTLALGVAILVNILVGIPEFHQFVFIVARARMSCRSGR